MQNYYTHKNYVEKWTSDRIASPIQVEQHMQIEIMGWLTLEVRVRTYTQNAWLSSNKVSTVAPGRLQEGFVQLSPNVLRGIHRLYYSFFGGSDSGTKTCLHLCSRFVVERIDDIFNLSIASFGGFSLSITCSADSKLGGSLATKLSSSIQVC